MNDIREMLTLERIRGMYQDEDGFSKLPTEDLHGLRNYLDLLSDEIYQMKRAVIKELGRELCYLHYCSEFDKLPSCGRHKASCWITVEQADCELCKEMSPEARPGSITKKGVFKR